MSADLCPRFHRAIELVGSRWTGAILQVLMTGRARFSAVRSAVPGITDRMLSERLHALEAEGLVVRTVLPEAPIRVEYALTPKGHELQASLAAIARWAERWLPDPGPAAPGASKRPRGRSAGAAGRHARSTPRPRRRHATGD